MTSKLPFGYDRLSGNRPFPPALPKPLFLALWRRREGRMVLGFESELKAGIITSVGERVCPLWYGQKILLCWPTVVGDFHTALTLFFIVFWNSNPLFKSSKIKLTDFFFFSLKVPYTSYNETKGPQKELLMYC